MNYSIFRIPLNLHSVQSQASVPVFIGDTSIQLRISLSDGVKPYMIADGCLAKLSIKRPTGTHLEEFCKIENNTTIVYSFDQNENTAVVEGIHDCDITLYGKDGGVLGSPRFTMVVSEKVVNSDDIVISDEDHTTIDAIVAAEAARQDAETGRINNEAARVNSESERVQAEQQRALVEETRVAAEKLREENIAKAEEALALATEATKKANEAAEKANEAAEKVDKAIDGEYLTEEDIIDNLETSASNKPLSANQGVELKGMIDELLKNGVPGGGTPGESGADGVSVTHSWDGTVLKLTSASGTTYTDLKGAKGDPGTQGEKGDPGEPGAKGDPGEPGTPGAKGDPGEPGTSVTHYWDGTTLYVTSASGTLSADLKGAKGDKGEQGEQGEKGDPGTPGGKGDPGVSVTHSWNGSILTLNSASGTTKTDLKGEKGDPGTPGAKGDPGEPGEKGDPGTPGAKGDPGAPGEKGDPGTPGTSVTHYWDGTTLYVTSASGTLSADLKGANGVDGTNGKDGKDGVDGRTPTFGIHDDDELMVSYDGGVTWQILGFMPKVEEVKTINGHKVKLFVGTEEEYNALTLEEQVNNYAIITDDKKVYTLVFNSGAIAITNGTLLELGALPIGRTIDDIVGLGFQIVFASGSDSAVIDYSTCKTTPSFVDTNTDSDTYGKEVVPFSSSSTNVTTKGAIGIGTMLPYLCSINGKVYIHFKSGSFNRYVISESGAVTFDQKYLTDNCFKLFKVCYWFA